MTGERPCEVCSGLDRRTLYTVNGFPIVRCTRCGLVFVGTEISDEELIQLYDESYYEDPEATGYSGYGEAESRKRHHDRSLLDQVERLAPPGRMLEIGCAYGFFLDEARKRGWTVAGVEPSTHAAEYARSHFGLPVATALPEQEETPVGMLDAVVMWDVIEHLPHPRTTLERASEWLRPGGVLALSTGDVRSLSSRLHGADWSLMTPPWHQYYFSRATLRGLLEECGFDVVRTTGDGTVAVDPGSTRPRIRWAAALLTHPAVTRVARRLGAGAIMFVFAQKPSG